MRSFGTARTAAAWAAGTSALLTTLQVWPCGRGDRFKEVGFEGCGPVCLCAGFIAGCRVGLAEGSAEGE